MDAIHQQAIDQFSDWRWRLNNLYLITDKEGKRVPFRMNWAQEALFDEMHYMNTILKARQLGFTTFIQLFMLDACVFNKDISAGTIAHTLDDAQSIFRSKVKFPYDNLPEGLRTAVPLLRSNTTEMELGNNSAIRVGASLRSGTFQYLHVSEYGKLCAKFPEKAREVRTGALNTVQAGQIIFVESTAEGQEGDFYDMCERAKSKLRLATQLTALDFKFHFFPWWESPEYVLDPAGVVIDADHATYFAKLEENSGIKLTPNQRAWYVKKSETQQEDMKREYPSTPEEAFEASVEGAYYGQQMAKAELQRRIGDFPAHLAHGEPGEADYDPGYPVYSVWDIGHHDETAIWLFQILPGMVRWIGYYANSGEVMGHYLDWLEDQAELHGYIYKTHYVPHDIRVVEWSGSGLQRIEVMIEECRKRAIGKPSKVPDHAIEDRHNATRILIGVSQFHEASCSEGIKCLKNHRKEWDEEHGCWRDKPRKDWSIHGADSFGYASIIYQELKPEPAPVRGRMLTIGDLSQLPPGVGQVTLNDLWDMRKRPSKRI